GARPDGDGLAGARLVPGDARPGTVRPVGERRPHRVVRRTDRRRGGAAEGWRDRGSHARGRRTRGGLRRRRRGRAPPVVDRRRPRDAPVPHPPGARAHRLMALPRALARFNRLVTNRVLGVVAPWMPPFAVVVHRGRSSGRVYRTPVWAFRRGRR